MVSKQKGGKRGALFYLSFLSACLLSFYYFFPDVSSRRKIHMSVPRPTFIYLNLFIGQGWSQGYGKDLDPNQPLSLLQPTFEL